MRIERTVEGSTENLETFDIQNSSNKEIEVFVEPEGVPLVMAPGDVFSVKLYGGRLSENLLIRVTEAGLTVWEIWESAKVIEVEPKEE